jgi:hypothetical protein
MYKLTEKVQVLLSQADVEILNSIMLGKAMKIGKRPVPLSSFIRAIIRKYIDEETKNQDSFAEEQVEKLRYERMLEVYKDFLKNNKEETNV